MQSLVAFIRFLRPQPETLAYALFLAINATSIWGGVFPFLPLSFQTQSLMFWFFVAQATCFFSTFLIVAYVMYRNPAAMKTRAIAFSAAVYFVGWCFLIMALYSYAGQLMLTIVGGLFLGVGSAAFYLQWQRVFVRQGGEYAIKNLILGTVYAAPMYGALCLIPKQITMYVIPLICLPVMAASVHFALKKIKTVQEFDSPLEHPHVYRRAWSLLWRSTLCMGSFGWCSGLMRALAIHEPVVGNTVNVLSMGALFVAALCLLMLWHRDNVQLHLMGIYRLLFPIVITALTFLAFMPTGYENWLAAVFYGLYSVSILLLIIQTGQVSRDFGVNPMFLFGLMGGIIFFLHDAGFIAGSMMNVYGSSLGLGPTAIALVAVWFLATVYFTAGGKFNDAVASAFRDSSIELTHCPALSYMNTQSLDELIADDCAADVDTHVISAAGTADESVDCSGDLREEVSADAGEGTDHIAIQIEKLQQQYGLSTREAEVADLLVRGKTVARIAEELFVSENTVRTHSKRIYTKLNIHKKLELMDLMESL